MHRDKISGETGKRWPTASHPVYGTLWWQPQLTKTPGHQIHQRTLLPE